LLKIMTISCAATSELATINHYRNPVDVLSRRHPEA